MGCGSHRSQPPILSMFTNILAEGIPTFAAQPDRAI